jgi:hypothetical protein
MAVKYNEQTASAEGAGTLASTRLISSDTGADASLASAYRFDQHVGSASKNRVS